MEGKGGETGGEESGRDGKNYEESESGQVGELLALWGENMVTFKRKAIIHVIDVGHSLLVINVM